MTIVDHDAVIEGLKAEIDRLRDECSKLRGGNLALRSRLEAAVEILEPIEHYVRPKYPCRLAISEAIAKLRGEEL